MLCYTEGLFDIFQPLFTPIVCVIETAVSIWTYIKNDDSGMFSVAAIVPLNLTETEKIRS